MQIEINFKKFKEKLKDADLNEYCGKIQQIIGLTIESKGPSAKIGDICNIYSVNNKRSITAEVVGFIDNRVMLMPYGDLLGIGSGSKVISTGTHLKVGVGTNLKGRILNGLGEPIDGKGAIDIEKYYNTVNPAPDPLTRQRIRDVIPFGIKAMDALLTCGMGQRIGVFAGSGIGKSTLMGMIARNVKTDINVITLVGERGREVKEFIEKDLQEEGMRNSVLVVATSDQPAIVRVKAAMIGTAIAEYFRDIGMNVLLLMDSLTRFAMAQREIGMAIGEPPVSRGYTPSVFAKIPQLLERTGNSDRGSITCIYTVLVDGDDMNEPVADVVRGILDGHIVLSRDLANRNHYPAIDVLSSVSRLMPDLVNVDHLKNSNILKKLLSTYREAEDMINIGAYKQGTNALIDDAIRLNPKINELLLQGVNENVKFEDTCAMLSDIIGSLNEEI